MQRESFEWGVRLTEQPFSVGDHSQLTIQSDIGEYHPGRGNDIRITFPGVGVASPMRLLDAQVWAEALRAVVAETRAVVAQMKADAKAQSNTEPDTKPKAKPVAKAKPAAKPKPKKG